MRKFIKTVSGTVAAACILALATLFQSGSTAVSAQFETNTPRPTVPDLAFATNTPLFSPTPTQTATATLTPSLTPSPTETFTLTPTLTPTPIGPVSYPEGVNALTGMLFPSEEAMNRRNILIKISNYPPQVRPQSGLNEADVIYEYEVEGGVTRFAAIYRSNAPRHVGPVRSGRLLDMELVQMYEAIFSYSGASQPVQRLFFQQPWSYNILSPSIGDNCVEAGFCRFPGDGLAFEHTLYADTVRIWERATARQINIPMRARGFAFSEFADPNGILANDLYVNWYGQTDARWQWDAAASRWVRFTDGVPHFDAADGQQVWADNVIVIEVPHEERPDLFEEESNTRSQQINLWDQGRAYLFRDGQYYQGFWRRPCDAPPAEPTATPEGYTVTSPCGSRMGTALQLVYGNNVPMMMRPGRTWVMVVRWLGDVAITDVYTDTAATATALALSATPTRTMTPGERVAPEATLSTPMVIPR
ncbi:DUF3048 domain-containing protein [Anaerolineae bacterium CFX9]|nr:DUF3048 domain-containing protein [Anaerolineae bacterium CFX9]